MESYFFIELSSADSNFNWNELEHRAISSFSSTGIEEFSIEEAKVDEILGERSYSGADIPVSVIEEVEQTIDIENQIAKKFYFSSKEDAIEFQKSLSTYKNIKHTLCERPIEDWNESWRKSYSPIKVSENFEIIPSWEKESYKTDAENKLYIYPGMGFGTGSHETTFLCLKLLIKIGSLSPGIRCLDFGCGSGILALGLKRLQDNCLLDLYDIEKEALENCVQNIELNNFPMDNINLILPQNRNKLLEKYDIVFANILKNVLELELDFLSKSVEKDGHLILSGLLKEQENDIIDLYLKANPSLKLIEVARSGDWIAILFKLL